MKFAAQRAAGSLFVSGFPLANSYGEKSLNVVDSMQDSLPEKPEDQIPLRPVFNRDLAENNIMLPELSWQERVFLNHYIVDWNGTKAAIKAGYAQSNAASMACKMLKRPNVRDHLDYMIEQQRHQASFTIERMMAELSHVAFSSIGDLMDENGEWLPPHQLPASAMKAIKKYRYNNGRHEYEFHDKIKAMETLGRFLGMSDGRHLEDASQDIDDKEHVVIVLPDNNRTHETIANEK